MIAMGKSVAPFLWAAIALYVVAMALAYGVYTPLLSRQIKTLDTKGSGDPEYQTLARRSNQVGITMGILVIIILALKIFEPRLW
jgi:formate hydrogenlyase subunit 3/multisubunit Na+/H+ antiporter MnhD subunit